MDNWDWDTLDESTFSVNVQVIDDGDSQIIDLTVAREATLRAIIHAAVTAAKADGLLQAAQLECADCELIFGDETLDDMDATLDSVGVESDAMLQLTFQSER